MCFVPSEHDLGEDDIYDCVPCEDDGDDIYEDIIKVEVRQPMVRAIATNLCLVIGGVFLMNYCLSCLSYCESVQWLPYHSP